MCVIVYKPSKERISMKTLEQCARANPHLMGAMYFSNHGVEILRGYKTVRGLVARLPENWETSDICFHFRIATFGGVNTVNSHPFPLYNMQDYGLLHKNHATVRAALMHNGIVAREGSKFDLELYSDTMLLARDKLSKLSTTQVIERLESLAKKTSSRFLLLDSKKERLAKFFGEWFIDDGIYYSNLNWKVWDEEVEIYDY